jgi:glycine/D-amino acid oxidase-like deaminating enzyme
MGQPGYRLAIGRERVDVRRGGPDLALRIYAQAMRLTDDERVDPAALVAGEKANKGQKAAVVSIGPARERAA